MNLRRLNDEGLERLATFLDSLTTETPHRYPFSLLLDDKASEQLPVRIEIASECRFARRYEAARYLYEQFAALRTDSYQNLERDRGTWAWLALLWFEQLCGKDANGQYKPRERARWIPVLDNARRFYRHLLLGPYLLYRMHAANPTLIEPILSNRLEIATGEVFRTIIETPQFVSSAAVLDLFGRLYYNKSKGRLVRGAGSKGLGGARRLGDLLSQLDRTYDLHSIKPEHLLTLLPKEFRQGAHQT